LSVFRDTRQSDARALPRRDAWAERVAACRASLGEDRLIEFGRCGGKSKRSRGSALTGDLPFLGFTFICSRLARGKFHNSPEVSAGSDEGKVSSHQTGTARRACCCQPICFPKPGKMAAGRSSPATSTTTRPTNSSTLTAVSIHVTNLWPGDATAEAARQADQLSGSRGGRRLCGSKTANPIRGHKSPSPLDTQAWEPYAEWARTDLCGGREVTRVPTAKMPRLSGDRLKASVGT